MERSGAAPVMKDGKVGGNVAARIVTGGDGLDFLVVSRSARRAGQSYTADDDFCVVAGFDAANWRVDFYGKDASTLPTSDAPLHHAALRAAADEFHWTETPLVSLHGHALQTADQAQRLGIPCSVRETLFSTPDDMHELLSVLKLHPWPLHRVFVRKGHGFVVLRKTTAETVDEFRTNVAPFVA